MTARVDISPGESARVTQVNGDDGIRLRLAEMGRTPGCNIELVGVAPFGDPIEIALGGYRLSLRKSEAARIEILPIGT